MRGNPKGLDDYREAFREVFDDPDVLQQVAFEEFPAATPSGRRGFPGGIPPAIRYCDRTLALDTV